MQSKNVTATVLPNGNLAHPVHGELKLTVLPKSSALWSDGIREAKKSKSDKEVEEALHARITAAEKRAAARRRMTEAYVANQAAKNEGKRFDPCEWGQ